MRAAHRPVPSPRGARAAACLLAAALGACSSSGDAPPAGSDGGGGNGGGGSGAPTFTLVVGVIGSGSGHVRSDGGEVDCRSHCERKQASGTALRLTATADAGSKFVAWTESCSGADPACSVRFDADHLVYARFETLGPPGADRRLLIGINGQGSVRSSPAGLACSTSSCSSMFPAGTALELLAAPAAGWRLEGWGGACSGPGSCHVTLNADLQVFATFIQEVGPPPPGRSRVSVNFSGNGAGRVRSAPAGLDCQNGTPCSATFDNGTAVTLTASQGDNSRFSGWTGGGCSGTGPCTFTLAQDATLTAAFDLLPPPPDECDGLPLATAPGAYTAFSVTRDHRTDDSCLPGFADGSGTVAVSVENNLQPHDTRAHFVDPSGHEVGHHEGARLVLTEQLAGFMGTNVYGANFQWDLVRLASDGHLLTRIDGGLGSFRPVEDPLGGMVIASNTGPGPLSDYSADAVLRWSFPGLHDIRGVGVDRHGATLVLFDGAALYGANTVAGIWFDHAGAAGPTFKAFDGVTTGAGTTYELFQQVGSGLFVQQTNLPGAGSHEAWVRQFDSLDRVGSPPPAWLAARPHTRLHMVRGGRGYAVLPRESAVGFCSQTLEIASPSGRICGSATFPISGSACNTGSLRVGYDGTVIQLQPVSTTCGPPGPPCTCDWRWWSGILR